VNREHRLLTLALIIFLLAGTAIGYSQTPPGPNTIQHGEGINLPTITATDGYFYGAVNVTGALFGNFGTNPITTTGALVTSLINTGPGFTEVYGMDQDVTAASGVTFATVDTGQGANELYDMDQNVLTTSDVNFTSVEADDYYLRGSTNLTAWVEGLIDAGNYTYVSKNSGGEVGPRKTINLIEGANITITVVDDPAGDEIDVTITSTGGAGIGAVVQPYTFIVENDGVDATAWFSSNSSIAYGGVGDARGVNGAVHSSVIQACLNYIRSSSQHGGWVFLKSGTYSISSTLVMYSHQGLAGEYGSQQENYGTVLVAANGLNDNVIEFDTAKTGDGTNSTDFNREITIKDLCIDGNDAGVTGTCYGIYAFYSVKCLFDHLEIRDVEDYGLVLWGGAGVDSMHNMVTNVQILGADVNLRIGGSEENLITNLRTSDSGSCGIYLSGNINRIVNWVSIYDNVALRSYGGDRTSILGATIDRPDTDAFWLDGSINGVDNTQFEDLTVVDVGWHGGGVNRQSNTHSVFILEDDVSNVTVTNLKLISTSDPSLPRYLVECVDDANPGSPSGFTLGTRQINNRIGTAWFNTYFPNIRLLPYQFSAMSTSQALGTASTPTYLPIYGRSTIATTQGQTTAIPINYPCIANGIRVDLTAAPEGTDSRTFTLWVNNAATDVILTITGAATNGYNATGYAELLPGDLVEILTVANDTPVDSYGRASIMFMSREDFT